MIKPLSHYCTRIKNGPKTPEIRFSLYNAIPIWEQPAIFCFKVGQVLLNRTPGAENGVLRVKGITL
jgi:hypothetical protein